MGRFRDQFESNEAYNEWFRQYRLKNLEKMREYKRVYNKKWRRENGYPSEAKYRASSPEKVKAWNVVNMAIYRGKLKPEPCIKCGKKAQAHHEDYSKPLEIIWLCGVHHTELHRSRCG